MLQVILRAQNAVSHPCSFQSCSEGSGMLLVEQVQNDLLLEQAEVFVGPGRGFWMKCPVDIVGIQDGHVLHMQEKLFIPPAGGPQAVDEADLHI